jgi:polysaccharide biosynthesis protein PslA
MFHERLPETFQALPPAVERRRDVWSALLPRRGQAAARVALSFALAATDLAAILAITLVMELAYHLAWQDGSIWTIGLRGIRLAALLSLVIIATKALRSEYGLDSAMSRKSTFQRTFTLWLVAWAVVLVVSFMTKSTNDYSRIVSLGIFCFGLPVLVLTRAAMVRLVRRSLAAGSTSTSRVHLVGYEEDIARFYAGSEADHLGLRIVGTSYLRRVLRPDDVFVLVPWTDAAEVERCIDAFLRVPSALHLRPGAVLDRFPDLQVTRVGGVSGINIGRRPLNVGEIVLKRALDLTVATIALVSLSPLLAAIAVAIKLDSPGPVFFRQKRYGFNQQPFGVFKFRSMRADAGAAFRQATRNDSRITRVGAILRRTNLDELPQLINVLRGEMSLVGPRPHALAHDRSFERRIALYARRHNVRPGITGWAQVNGFRGETLTDLDMERRVSCDLHYIDNWSIWFDIQIMVQTLVSRRAYKNAF